MKSPTPPHDLSVLAGLAAGTGCDPKSWVHKFCIPAGTFSQQKSQSMDVYLPIIKIAIKLIKESK
jgi:hypothetical protein